MCTTALHVSHFLGIHVDVVIIDARIIAIFISMLLHYFVPSIMEA